MSAAPEISVVLGTLNRFESLRRCIESIFSETGRAVVVHVTDAGSTDGTIEYLNSNASDRLVPHLVGKKLGQARAYNGVFQSIDTPYVAWLSDDNEVVNHGLDTAAGILDRRLEIGMVGLKVKDRQGPFVDSPYIGGISEVGVLNVNQGMLRTSVLREVGYFSEAFGTYGIDPDLTAKILYSGHDVVYTKAVALNHYRDWPSDAASAEFAAHDARLRRSLDLYREKYSGFGDHDRAWVEKKKLWSRLGRQIRRRVSSATERNLRNAFLARHIHPLDAWLNRQEDFHLRQHVRPLV